ncbi:CGH_3_HP_G0042970.mRNA.1.CDS.1 [Saccharomyces cerevisiae]|nr:CGH_3_HP_G0042970.mRNA.1.CDS.1 [Saccharomyces cerevisiae]CAI4985883.1 CGH_1_HP_G0063270.mRNA.1.CDS.1 [Saccharomyces cerevisiae]CAI5101852.1 CGH_1_HP_G0128110.mRNA.1.CDS.1 [Saccharomyces cerevisiae]CAI6579794.1 CGH_3_HP_G0042970.mRNA.1.CDS.1 [Saccharomyces cerevisiae]CAI6844733.1 CGH_1_HP_G0063270.mRNA.1.CDS.1 [Saccharomyces cerevisiae]
MKLGSKQVKIISLLLLDTVFFGIEITTGYLSHSLALIADSFHMLNDIISLVVALWAVNVAKNRNPDSTYTYGWKRAEILGALINAVFLIALCVSILIEALQRIIAPPVIENPKFVLYVGVAGLISNTVGLFLFHDNDQEHGHGHGHSHGGIFADHEMHMPSSHTHTHAHVDGIENTTPMDSTDNIGEIMPNAIVDSFMNENTRLLTPENASKTPSYSTSSHTIASGGNYTEHNKRKRSLNMHGVFLHVLGDALGNIGVMLSAFFIWKTDYSWKYYTDPLVSLIITGIIFSSALPLSCKASKILLQATPSTLSGDQVEGDLLKIPGIIAIHDFHIWNLTESIFIASLYIKLDISREQFTDLAKIVRSKLHRYGIHSATLQPEFITREVTSTERAGDSQGDHLQNDPLSLRPKTYGTGISGSTCLIDDAANCNTADCLEDH